MGRLATSCAMLRYLLLRRTSMLRSISAEVCRVAVTAIYVQVIVAFVIFVMSVLPKELQHAIWRNERLARQMSTAPANEGVKVAGAAARSGLINPFMSRASPVNTSTAYCRACTCQEACYTEPCAAMCCRQ